MKTTIRLEGIFNKIEDAIHYYYKENKIKPFEIQLNVFELSLFIEEYLKTGNTSLKDFYKKLRSSEILGEKESK